jgi:hypothetical protein
MAWPRVSPPSQTFVYLSYYRIWVNLHPIKPIFGKALEKLSIFHAPRRVKTSTDCWLLTDRSILSTFFACGLSVKLTDEDIRMTFVYPPFLIPESTRRTQAILDKGSLFYSHCALAWAAVFGAFFQLVSIVFPTFFPGWQELFGVFSHSEQLLWEFTYHNHGFEVSCGSNPFCWWWRYEVKMYSFNWQHLLANKRKIGRRLQK